MARLFVALWPPDKLVRAMASVRWPAVDGLRWTRPERLHVTLRFLGECDIADAVAAVGQVSFPPVEVTLGPSLARLGRGVVMIPARGADGLAAAVAESTRNIGRPPPRRRFTGHMTVARFRRDPPSGVWPPEELPALSASFTASEMALTRVEPSGAYVNVGCFTLTDEGHPPPGVDELQES